MPSEVIPTATSSASGVSAATVRIFDPPFQLHVVGEQITDLLNTTKHVLDQLHEAKRLRRLKESLLDPVERKWIDRAIADAEAASHAVANLLEPGRVEYETRNGKIGLRTRMAWVLRDRRRATDKCLLLLACQNSLLTAISHLHTRKPAVISPVSNATISGCEKEIDVNNEGQALQSYEMSKMLGWRRSNRTTHSDDSLSKATTRNAEAWEMP
ncbi:hypothetical protein AJ80_02008 [Polytolypa hystricis UAMH7299]|uniref:Uncharacterized protein n=1 Tax=Polytolypa hystricis (strain UAMH7299) TaxID=1447883 RepID=A0A2B7YQJ5_POLH7|nr:hypothetical protein AJ80_02008 [Polytolypa hystricis UAMH7299]